MSRRRIRVAHLITNFAVGGAQDYLLMIVRGIDRSRFQPMVAGSMEGDWAPVVQSLPGLECYDMASLRREISLSHDIASILEIRKFCREKRVDILHTHSSKPGVVGRLGGWLAGVPAVVHTVHGFSFNDFMPWWKRAFFVSIERAMSLFTTTLLLYSHGDEVTAKRHRIGARRSVETFYYGIDYAPFEHTPDRNITRKALGFTERDRVIGFTGRFSEQKALHILLDAFARVHAEIPEARLLLVGDGQLRPQLERRIRNLGVGEAVVITGFRSDVPALLGAMDLFAMTSLWEGLSRSLAEAMYAKLPAVVTDVGGTADAIGNNERGWLIPPKDVTATARALVDALAHPEECADRAARGYRWAREHFDVQKMQQRMAMLYESLMENHLHKEDQTR